MGVTKETRLNEKQKEALLVFMENHPDFGRGRINASQASQVFKNLWERLRVDLNRMPGASKTISGWKEVWSEMRSYARQYACSNGTPKPTKTGGGAMSDEEDVQDNDEEPLQTDSPYVNRIMAIIGWESALGIGVRDDLATSSDEDEPVFSTKKTVVDRRVITKNPVDNNDSLLSYQQALADLLKATEKQETAREQFNSAVYKVVI